MSDIDNNANIDKIKYILSRNGSLRFKKDIDDARTLLGSNNISVLKKIYKETMSEIDKIKRQYKGVVKFS